MCVFVCVAQMRLCVCGTVGLSLNTQRPRELPRAERTASVCVLVPSKQGNLENTKGAANKHNLIPLSSYTWLWIMQRYSKDVCLSLCECVCVCLSVCDAMPKPWLTWTGGLPVCFCTCMCVICVHEQMCGMRVRPFIILQWEACQCCWEMAGLCPITPRRLCLYCQSCAKMSALDTWHRNSTLLYTKVYGYQAGRDRFLSHGCKSPWPNSSCPSLWVDKMDVIHGVFKIVHLTWEHDDLIGMHEI